MDPQYVVVQTGFRTTLGTALLVFKSGIIHLAALLGNTNFSLEAL
jgi:hypothetical protein